MKAQRLRFRYRIAPAATGLSQRNLVGAWQRAMEEARLPLAFSAGKRPTPQISLAAPLPFGVTSDWELVDVFLAERVDPQAALHAVRGGLPEGIEVVSASEVGVSAPSLQSQVRWAEYRVEIIGKDALTAEEIRQAVERLLKADTWPAEYRRETRVRQYDLRPLVLDVRVEEEREDSVVLMMRLRAEPEMTARAEQVVLAMGLPEARRIHRLRLYVGEEQPAVTAYRRLGEPEE